LNDKAHFREKQLMCDGTGRQKRKSGCLEIMERWINKHEGEDQEFMGGRPNGQTYHGPMKQTQS
jgi:hypothetical protein